MRNAAVNIEQKKLQDRLISFRDFYFALNDGSSEIYERLQELVLRRVSINGGYLERKGAHG